MLKKTPGIAFVLLALALTVSCGDSDALPKPSAYLNLEYPIARYNAFEGDCPYGFFVNTNASVKAEKNCSYTIHYPKMKATVFLTYKTVNGDIKELLRDAQTLTYKHVIKADNITEQPYINPDKKAYGMFYSVAGNAATNSQFYLTDSTKHFLRGSLYFYAKPNFDSIMPAADYIKNDMQTLMETIHWK